MSSLTYWKDGINHEVPPIYEKGKIGQIVIIDKVWFGEEPSAKNFNFAQYPQPYAFTIIGKVDGHDGRYTFRDQAEKEFDYNSASCGFLYSVTEWLQWRKASEAEKFDRKEREVQKLQGHLDLLTKILTNQGIRIVTREQANTLGLTV